MPTTSPPGLRLLLGPQASGVFAAAIGEYGAELTALRVADVHVTPSGGVRVRYVADMRRADGARRSEVLVATTGDHIPPGAAVIAGEFEGAAVEVGVWQWPLDPVLPGLHAATHPARLAELLTEAGLAAPKTLRVTVRAYRPGQRAVLEVCGATDLGLVRWFVKVVPPAAVADLRRRHALIADVLPVPQVIAASDDGVVVLPEAPGTVMRHVLTVDGPHRVALPPPAALGELLDALPLALMRLPGRRGPLQRIGQSARVLALTSGCSAAGIDSELQPIMDELRSVSTEPTGVAPVHGDFYDSQLLVRDGNISALIDVDTAGPGDRADEWATFLGHLSVLGRSSARARSYCDEVLAHADRHVDPVALRARAAAVTLGLATGPFRTQRADWPEQTAARLEVTRRWLSSMRDHSSRPPAPLI